MNYLKIWLILVIFSYTGYANELNYSSQNLFPVHNEMVAASQFWIKIFGEHNTNEYLIHDSRKLNIVYEVITWGKLDESKADDPYSKEQKKYFKNKIKFYKEILVDLAAVYPDTNKMNTDQKKAYRLLSGFKSKNDFLEAANRIRVQKGQKNKFRRGLEISGRYMSYLKKTFEKYGLPEELTVLPHVESSFNYKAYSSAGAAGIWQFTRGTGKQFLKISYEVDERLDPILATEAAAKLLKRNFEILGSWPLAITAYNHGAYGMKRAVKKMKTTDLNSIIKKYRSRYFKFASRNFYCEFIAALHVSQNYQTYFGAIAFEDPIQYKEFRLSRYMKYETLSKYLDMDKNLFRKYNPALRLSVYNNSKYMPKGYRVRLPNHISTDSLLASIPEAAYYANQKQSKYYRIRYGDTLSDIARRFGTSVEMLLAVNNISNEHFIRRGMTIRLPDKTDAPVILAAADKSENKTEEAKEAAPEVANETPLETPPADYSRIPIVATPSPEPAKDSTLAHAAVSTNGTNLTDLEIEFIQQKHPAVGYIRVEPEETLGHYSDWLQIKTQSIRNWNNLSFKTPIHLNKKIKLVFKDVTPGEFNSMRLEYHRGLEEDFFVNYEITDTLVHQVKNGENLWYLCNYVFNLPFWLIVDYNKEIDFGKLKPGDKLVVPAVKAKG